MIEYIVHHRHVLEPPVLHEATAGIEYAQSKACDDMTIDFEMVEYIASPFIGVLAKVASVQREMGRRLIFRNVSPSMRAIFELSGINTVVEIRNHERT